MDQEWRKTLEASGARIREEAVADFGNPEAERVATLKESVVAVLSHLGLIEFTGEDCETFLHGQVSCDVRGLAAQASTYGGYCTPKGRLLADFLLWRYPAGFRMALSRSVASSIAKRLGMYVLRSKVRIADASDTTVLLGAAGAEAPAVLGELFAELPRRPHQEGRAGDSGSVIMLPGDRFLIALPVQKAPEIWWTLTAKLRPVASNCWEWLDIRNGVPLITAKTQEQLVPQMANLDLIGAVSFTKGCYPGQEVVARTRNIGKIKRRMYLARVAAESPPAAGDELYSDDLGDQPSGTVVNSQPAPGGGYDILAVVQIASRERSVSHLKSLNGPVLEFLDLPYPVNYAAS